MGPCSAIACLDFSHCDLLEKGIKQCKLGHIRQVDICKKKSIIDGPVKVESLLITGNMNSKVAFFFKESSRLKRLHIDGTVEVKIC